MPPTKPDGGPSALLTGLAIAWRFPKIPKDSGTSHRSVPIPPPLSPREPRTGWATYNGCARSLHPNPGDEVPTSVRGSRLSSVGRDDWFRGPAWDDGTREAFEGRLERARGQRPQYLRIKGHDLTNAEDARLWPEGRKLLRRVLEEHPDDTYSVISAHRDLAASLAREERYPEAAEEYRRTLDLQRDLTGGSIDTGASLALAEVIVKAGLREHYEEVPELLNAFISSRAGLFPSDQFRILVTEARLAERLDQSDVARRDAVRALELLGENRAPFPRHPGVGLINADESTFRELERLADLR